MVDVSDILCEIDLRIDKLEKWIAEDCVPNTFRIALATRISELRSMKTWIEAHMEEK